MAYGVVLEFPGVGQAEYDAVNKHLGLDVYSANANWPTGMISHAAGTSPNGLCVYEVWASKADQTTFMEGELGAALAGAEMPPPARVTEVDLFNHQVV